MDKTYFIYILTNKTDTTLYIGITNNLQRRLYEHKNNLIEGFSKKYKLHKLIYYEEYLDVKEAIKREKQLKNWHKDWKLSLIRRMNPELRDLSLNW